MILCDNAASRVDCCPLLRAAANCCWDHGSATIDATCWESCRTGIVANRLVRNARLKEFEQFSKDSKNMARSKTMAVAVSCGGAFVSFLRPIRCILLLFLAGCMRFSVSLCTVFYAYGASMIFPMFGIPETLALAFQM